MTNTQCNNIINKNNLNPNAQSGRCMNTLMTEVGPIFFKYNMLAHGYSGTTYWHISSVQGEKLPMFTYDFKTSETQIETIQFLLIYRLFTMKII